MNQEPSTFYRYRAFNAITIQSLCHDTMYFACPGSFNDPLDCSPYLECDSNLADLRELFTLLFRKRILSEVLAALKSAGCVGESLSAHADQKTQSAVEQELAGISYHATNPDYSGNKDENEAWLLANAIDGELRLHYDRGVCCFSRSYTSPVLWSHYGDHHRGICIGYSTDRLPKQHPQKVIYKKSRNIKTSELVQAFLRDDSEVKKELDQKIFLRKAREWSYEKEWRLIDQQGIQKSPLFLKDITFGIRCPAAIIHTVIKALLGRNRNLRFYEIHSIPGKNTLRRKPLEFDECAHFFPHVAISPVEAFGIKKDDCIGT